LRQNLQTIRRREKFRRANQSGSRGDTRRAHTQTPRPAERPSSHGITTRTVVDGTIRIASNIARSATGTTKSLTRHSIAVLMTDSAASP
jgi:hypothetical protein